MYAKRNPEVEVVINKGFSAENFKNQFAALSTISALLAGFSLGSIVSVTADQSNDVYKAFVVTSSITMLLQLFACIAAVVCYLILSTGAEEGFEHFWWERVLVFGVFSLGLLGFYVSLAFLVLIKLDHGIATDIMIALCSITAAATIYFIFWIIRKGAKIALAEIEEEEVKSHISNRSVVTKPITANEIELRS